MNKLLILAAFAVVASAANVEAADGKRVTRAQAAKDPSHPVTKANAEAKKAGRKADVTDVVEAAKEKAAVEKLEAGEQGKFAKAKAWLGNRTKTQVVGAVGVTLISGLIVEAIVNKDKSLLGKLLKLVRGTKAEEQVSAEVSAQLAEVAAR